MKPANRPGGPRRLRPGPLASSLGLLIVSCCLAGCATPEPGDARAATDGETRVVRVATSGDYPPFSDWPDGSAEPGGFEPDLMRRWAEAADVQIEWVRFRWPELVSDARAGAFDLAAGGITVRSDRSLVGTFGVPVARTSAVVLVKSSSGLGLDDLDDAEQRIAVNRGGHLERVARARFPHAVLLPTTPNSAVPERLATDDVVAVVTDSQESPIWRGDHEDWLQLGPLTRDEKAIFAAPGRAALVAEVDTWLLGAHGHRALLQLREQHLGVDPHASPPGAVLALLAAVDERLALMPDVACYKHAKGLPITVPERESKVLDAGWSAVQRAAERVGVEPPRQDDVRALYRALIEAAKEVQRGVPVSTSSEAAVPDLDGEIRPALIRIGDRIATLIVMLPDDHDDDLAMLVLDELLIHDLSEPSLHAIHEALETLLSEKGKRRGFGRIF